MLLKDGLADLPGKEVYNIREQPVSLDSSGVTQPEDRTFMLHPFATLYAIKTCYLTCGCTIRVQIMHVLVCWYGVDSAEGY